MDKEFVPYEPSLDMKELGFDEPCFGEYRQWDGNEPWLQLYQDLSECSTDPADYEYTREALAPTFSQAFRWFRVKYDWQHSIEPTADQHSHQLGYNYWIWNYKTGEEYHTMPKNRPSGDWEYKSYEEAELACLIKLIEIANEQQ